jgi:multidrug resistance efflux pump
MPILVTLAAVALAGLLGWAAWNNYMGAPWTRDATVRAYVVTMAPEVTGRIVELPVADNRYVRKGDLLMAIDPTNFTIAVSQAEAAPGERANIDAQMAVQQAQTPARRSRIRRRQRSCSHSNRPHASRRSRKTAGAPFRTPSSSRPVISRLLRSRPHVQTRSAQRQVDSLKAQRMSAEANVTVPSSTQASAGGSRAHADCLSC